MTASKIASFQACVTTIKPRIHTTFEKGVITHFLPVRDPAPCVTILVHGVNDVGEAYQAQEEGLCLGLNERLFRKDLAAGQYKLPKPDRSDPLVADPDAVYYKRALSDHLYTPVIPFYWGFREEEAVIDKDGKHGQRTDRTGNRLDARGIKNGGPFANATSNIPDMWSDGMALGFLNLLAGDPTHPILKGPPRTYMVLAAQRLAMLIRLIRDASADDTVNVVAHSQGCLVSLLAQAFLQADGERPADCLILNHPPYSLHETLLETTEQALRLQTVQARLDTLVNLVKTVTSQTHAQPAYGGSAFQRDPSKPNFAICGKGWKAAQDRDNRGKVYLYFCPDDEVVGFSKIQGIGWQGVPDQVKSRLADSSSRLLPALQALGDRFMQRVFTSRHRDGKPQLVGVPPHTYMLCTKMEAPVFWISGAPRTAAPPVDQTRSINGEALPAPCAPQMGGGRVAIGPIDAATAITNDGIRKRAPQLLNDPRPPEARQGLGPQARRGTPTMFRPPNDKLFPYELRQLEKALNKDKEQDDRVHIDAASYAPHFQVRVERDETPNEARLRWQSQEWDRNSHHSSIVTAVEHGRRVTAYDLAIGAGWTASNRAFFEFLCLVADWRVDLDKKTFDQTRFLEDEHTKEKFFNDINPAYQKLIRETWTYAHDGILPAIRPLDGKQAPGVISRTNGEEHMAHSAKVHSRGGATSYPPPRGKR